MTPMTLAAYNGYLKVVQDLAACNANLDAQDSHGMAPMALAAFDG